MRTISITFQIPEWAKSVDIVEAGTKAVRDLSNCYNEMNVDDKTPEEMEHSGVSYDIARID